MGRKDLIFQAMICCVKIAYLADTHPPEAMYAMLRNLVTVSMLALLSALPAATAWADGAVYAMTNALDDNQVLVYHRASDGNLQLM